MSVQCGKHYPQSDRFVKWRLAEKWKREEKIVPKKMLATSQPVQSISSLEGQPLVEEDANGGSII